MENSPQMKGRSIVEYKIQDRYYAKDTTHKNENARAAPRSTRS